MAELSYETLSFPSSDGHSTVAGYLYLPQDLPQTAAPRAVIQLSHGMCEYVQRYRHLAAFFAAQGIAVAGNDHLGHGATAAEADRGHYGEAHGAEHLLQDLRAMNALLHERFPNVPILLYGHSMGSFFARWYAETWPDTIHALILSGTAGPDFTNRVGEALAALISAVRGERHVSPLMVKLNFGPYNRRIANPASPNAWLTRDETCVSAYDADPLCTFSFTIGTYREMLRVLNHVSTHAWAEHMPAGLPVLLVAGEEDPVGSYGKGVRRVYRMLRTAGVRDVTCHLWKGGRHEMHNELDRDAFLRYVLGWVEKRI